MQKRRAIEREEYRSIIWVASRGTGVLLFLLFFLDKEETKKILGRINSADITVLAFAIRFTREHPSEEDENKRLFIRDDEAGMGYSKKRSQEITNFATLRRLLFLGISDTFFSTGVIYVLLQFHDRGCVAVYTEEIREVEAPTRP